MMTKILQWTPARERAAHASAQALVDQVHSALELTTLPMVPLSATHALKANLERSMVQYAARADELQAQIDNATGELVDVRQAQEAAAKALDALIGEVVQHALDLELRA